MDRLTHERCNGIKTGYWSTAKKEELIQRLAAYENTGLEPEQIEVMKGHSVALMAELEEREFPWISVNDRLPKVNPDIEVLVIASGKGGNIRLEEAYAFACYSGKDGWVLDEYPEIEDPKIDWWMPLPDAPEVE